LLLGSARHVIRALGYGLIGGVAVAITAVILTLNGRPDLETWHKVRLDREFSVDTKLNTFTEYLANEEALFDQLDEQVYLQQPSDDGTGINRFHRGSLSDPASLPVNWNRSFEMVPGDARAGAVLLHGMSDSPYSLRSVASRLHGRGAHVVGLRIPGHGTAPAGLLRVDWEDMAAAVRLAVRHVNELTAGKPLFIIGYSNGAALAVEYALAALEDESLPQPDGLVLISAAMGVSPLAAFAIWQERLGHLLGLEKIAWNSLLPEYDPYKYNSFALNAAIQVHRLTVHLNNRVAEFGSAGRLKDFPPVLAFQSAVDSTVTADALISSLFSRLESGEDEIFIFDINRYTNVESVLSGDPSAWINGLIDSESQLFTVTTLVNENEASRRIQVQRNIPGVADAKICATGLEWPAGLFSLSHVALPFPPDDPVYGWQEVDDYSGIRLGMMALRGENRVLRITPSDMLRLRWNPFHDEMMSRIAEFTGLGLYGMDSRGLGGDGTGLSASGQCE
jgi:pimeloyl-ACP methyl ester carboxylesterase